MKRAVLYLRVSTVDQTTANQERELREIAAEWVARLSKSTKITASAAPRAGIGGRR
jgi:DNA invertase Pin-like site-specific DNA recombinase